MKKQENPLTDLTPEEKRLKRVWQKTLKEIREIDKEYGEGRYVFIETKTYAGKAYYYALLRYAQTTKSKKLPEVSEPELYELFERAYKQGGKRIEIKWFFLLMRKFCSPLQDKESKKAKELNSLDPRAIMVIQKRYFEEKSFDTIRNEMQITSARAQKLCELAIQILRT